MKGVRCMGGRIVGWFWKSVLKTCAVLSRPVVSNSWNPMDCGRPGPSVHGILQARILE